MKSESPKDELLRWAKNRRSSSFWVAPSRDVQRICAEIAEYVQGRYGQDSPAKTADFLAKADGWVIAHAKHSKGTVVTLEGRVNRPSLTPKIPNVCSHFNVPCVSTAEMLRMLGFRLE